MKKFLATTCVAILLTACSCGNKVAGSSGSSSIVPTDVAIVGASNDLNKVGDRVFFTFDSSALSNEAKDTLDKQGQFIKQNPSNRFVIEGYCDERGTREYNLGLGERRAHSAKQYLIHKGVTADRLSVVSFGKDKPAVPGHNEEAWKQNRRAVTKIAE